MPKRMKRHSKPKYRLMSYGPYSSASLGVYNTKKEANEFKMRTKKKWNSDPALKKLMKDETFSVVPLTESERSKY